MSAGFEGLTLAIDTTSDLAGVALLEGGVLLAETTWRTRQSHSRQLLPAVDWMLGLVERDKAGLEAIAVCLGPGSYAGMRVGLSTAKTLAYALGLPIVGVGRLEADALPVAEASEARVVAVQAAGRAELAYAVYRAGGSPLIELLPPALGRAEALLEALEAGDVVTGDVEKLEESVAVTMVARQCRLLASPAPRAVSVGRLGLQTLARGEIDNAEALVPLYLRAPAIGPQPPR